MDNLIIMTEIIDKIRKSIKRRVGRSDDIRQYSSDLLKLALNIKSDPNYCLSDNDNKLINSWEEISSLFGEKISIDSLENDNMLVEEIIFDNLKNECKSHHNMWRCSIYGSCWGDGTDELDIYNECYDPYNIDEPNKRLDHNFLTLNYCGQSPKLSRYFCENCESNFKKIHHFMSRGELHILANNWYTHYEPDPCGPIGETGCGGQVSCGEAANLSFIPKLETMKEVQSYEKFVEKNPDVDIKSKNVCKFDDYFDDKLDSHLDKIREKDIFNVGWYFTGDLTPLLKVPNLKGLILGHWFDGDLNVLKSHPGLKFIQVRYSYNRYICDSLYDITFRL